MGWERSLTISDNRELKYALVIRFILASLLLLVLLTANLRLFVTPTYVFWQSDRLETGREASVGPENDASVATIIDYLNNGAKVLPDLSEREAVHLADVRRLFNSLARLSMGAAAALLAALVLVGRASSRPDTARHLAWAAAGACGLVLLFLAALLVNFSWIFTRFHQLFFAPDSWLFSSDTLLIQAFPEQFWLVTGASWIGLTLVELLTIALAAGVGARFTRAAN